MSINSAVVLGWDSQLKESDPGWIKYDASNDGKQ